MSDSRNIQWVTENYGGFAWISIIDDIYFLRPSSSEAGGCILDYSQCDWYKAANISYSSLSAENAAVYLGGPVITLTTEELEAEAENLGISTSKEGWEKEVIQHCDLTKYNTRFIESSGSDHTLRQDDAISVVGLNTFNKDTETFTGLLSAIEFKNAGTVVFSNNGGKYGVAVDVYDTSSDFTQICRTANNNDYGSLLKTGMFVVNDFDVSKLEFYEPKYHVIEVITDGTITGEILEKNNFLVAPSRTLQSFAVYSPVSLSVKGSLYGMIDALAGNAYSTSTHWKIGGKDLYDDVGGLGYSKSTVFDYYSVKEITTGKDGKIKYTYYDYSSNNVVQAAGFYTTGNMDVANDLIGDMNIGALNEVFTTKAYAVVSGNTIGSYGVFSGGTLNVGGLITSEEDCAINAITGGYGTGGYGITGGTAGYVNKIVSSDADQNMLLFYDEAAAMGGTEVKVDIDEASKVEGKKVRAYVARNTVTAGTVSHYSSKDVNVAEYRLSYKLPGKIVKTVTKDAAIEVTDGEGKTVIQDVSGVTVGWIVEMAPGDDGFVDKDQTLLIPAASSSDVFGNKVEAYGIKAGEIAAGAVGCTEKTRDGNYVIGTGNGINTSVQNVLIQSEYLKTNVDEGVTYSAGISDNHMISSAVCANAIVIDGNLSGDYNSNVSNILVAAYQSQIDYCVTYKTLLNSGSVGYATTKGESRVTFSSDDDVKWTIDAVKATEETSSIADSEVSGQTSSAPRISGADSKVLTIADNSIENFAIDATDAGSIKVNGNLGGEYTVSTTNVQLSDSTAAGIRAKDLNVAGVFNGTISVTNNAGGCSVAATNYYTNGIRICGGTSSPGSFIVDAIDGVISVSGIVTGTSSDINKAVGIYVNNSSFTNTDDNVLDIIGSISVNEGGYGIAGNVVSADKDAVFNGMNIRISGSIDAGVSGYAVSACSISDSANGVPITILAADKVEIAGGAAVIGAVSLGGVEGKERNVVIVDSNARLTGDIKRQSPTSVVLRLNSCMMDGTLVNGENNDNVNNFTIYGSVYNDAISSITVNLNDVKLTQGGLDYNLISEIKNSVGTKELNVSFVYSGITAKTISDLKAEGWEIKCDHVVYNALETHIEFTLGVSSEVTAGGVFSLRATRGEEDSNNYEEKNLLAVVLNPAEDDPTKSVYDGKLRVRVSSDITDMTSDYFSEGLDDLTMNFNRETKVCTLGWTNNDSNYDPEHPEGTSELAYSLEYRIVTLDDAGNVSDRSNSIVRTIKVSDMTSDRVTVDIDNIEANQILEWRVRQITSDDHEYNYCTGEWADYYTQKAVNLKQDGNVLSWETSGETDGVVRYQVEYVVGGKLYVKNLDAGETSYSVTEGDVESWRVRRYDSSTAPTNVFLSESGKDLSWTNNAGPNAQYVVFYHEVDDPSTLKKIVVMGSSPAVTFDKKIKDDYELVLYSETAMTGEWVDYVDYTEFKALSGLAMNVDGQTANFAWDNVFKGSEEAKDEYYKVSYTVLKSDGSEETRVINCILEEEKQVDGKTVNEYDLDRVVLSVTLGEGETLVNWGVRQITSASSMSDWTMFEFTNPTGLKAQYQTLTNKDVSLTPTFTWNTKDSVSGQRSDYDFKMTGKSLDGEERNISISESGYSSETSITMNISDYCDLNWQIGGRDAKTLKTFCNVGEAGEDGAATGIAIEDGVISWFNNLPNSSEYKYVLEYVVAGSDPRTVEITGRSEHWDNDRISYDTELSGSKKLTRVSVLVYGADDTEKEKLLCRTDWTGNSGICERGKANSLSAPKAEGTKYVLSWNNQFISEKERTSASYTVEYWYVNNRTNPTWKSEVFTGTCGYDYETKTYHLTADKAADLPGYTDTVYIMYRVAQYNANSSYQGDWVDYSSNWISASAPKHLSRTDNDDDETCILSWENTTANAITYVVYDASGKEITSVDTAIGQSYVSVEVDTEDVGSGWYLVQENSDGSSAGFSTWYDPNAPTELKMTYDRNNGTVTLSWENKTYTTDYRLLYSFSEHASAYNVESTESLYDYETVSSVNKILRDWTSAGEMKEGTISYQIDNLSSNDIEWLVRESAGTDAKEWIPYELADPTDLGITEDDCFRWMNNATQDAVYQVEFYDTASKTVKYVNFRVSEDGKLYGSYTWGTVTVNGAMLTLKIENSSFRMQNVGWWRVRAISANPEKVTVAGAENYPCGAWSEYDFADPDELSMRVDKSGTWLEWKNTATVSGSQYEVYVNELLFGTIDADPSASRVLYKYEGNDEVVSWGVKAVSAAGESTSSVKHESDLVSYSSECALPNTLNVEYDRTANKANLKWNNVLKGVDGYQYELEYRIITTTSEGAEIYSATLTQQCVPVGHDLMSIVLENITSNQRVEWKVRTISEDGEINEWVDYENNLPVSLSQTEVSDGAVTLSWINHSNSANFQLQYRIISDKNTYTEDDAVVVPVLFAGNHPVDDCFYQDGTLYSYTVTGLTEGQTVEWRVRALVDNPEYGAWTKYKGNYAEKSEFTGAPQRLYQVEYLKDGKTVTETVQAGIDGKFTCDLSGANSNSVQYRLITNNTEYGTWNYYGESESSFTGDVSIPDSTSVGVTQNTNSILQWTDADNTDTEKYVVQYLIDTCNKMTKTSAYSLMDEMSYNNTSVSSNGSCIFGQMEVTDTSLLVSTSAVNQPIFWRVKAVSQSGKESDWADGATIKVGASDTAPILGGSITLERFWSSGNPNETEKDLYDMSVSWSAAYNSGIGIKEYVVTCTNTETNETQTKTIAHDPSKTSFSTVFTDLEQVTYSYGVYAVDNHLVKSTTLGAEDPALDAKAPRFFEKGSESTQLTVSVDFNVSGGTSTMTPSVSWKEGEDDFQKDYDNQGCGIDYYTLSVNRLDNDDSFTVVINSLSDGTLSDTGILIYNPESKTITVDLTGSMEPVGIEQSKTITIDSSGTATFDLSGFKKDGCFYNYEYTVSYSDGEYTFSMDVVNESPEMNFSFSVDSYDNKGNHGGIDSKYVSDLKWNNDNLGPYFDMTSMEDVNMDENGIYGTVSWIVKDPYAYKDGSGFEEPGSGVKDQTIVLTNGTRKINLVLSKFDESLWTESDIDCVATVSKATGEVIIDFSKKVPTKLNEVELVAKFEDGEYKISMESYSGFGYDDLKDILGDEAEIGFQMDAEDNVISYYKATNLENEGQWTWELSANDYLSNSKNDYQSKDVSLNGSFKLDPPVLPEDGFAGKTVSFGSGLLNGMVNWKDATVEQGYVQSYIFAWRQGPEYIGGVELVSADGVDFKELLSDWPAVLYYSKPEVVVETIDGETTASVVQIKLSAKNSFGYKEAVYDPTEHCYTFEDSNGKKYILGHSEDVEGYSLGCTLDDNTSGSFFVDFYAKSNSNSINEGTKTVEWKNDSVSPANVEVDSGTIMSLSSGTASSIATVKYTITVTDYAFANDSATIGTGPYQYCLTINGVEGEWTTASKVKYADGKYTFDVSADFEKTEKTTWSIAVRDWTNTTGTSSNEVVWELAAPGGTITDAKFDFSTAVVSGGTGSSSAKCNLYLYNNDTILCPSGNVASYYISYRTEDSDWTAGPTVTVYHDPGFAVKPYQISLDAGKDYLVKLTVTDDFGISGTFDGIVRANGDTTGPKVYCDYSIEYGAAQAGVLTYTLKLSGTDMAYDDVAGVGIASYRLKYWKEGESEKTASTVTFTAGDGDDYDYYSLKLDATTGWNYVLTGTDKAGNIGGSTSGCLEAGDVTAPKGSAHDSSGEQPVVENRRFDHKLTPHYTDSMPDVVSSGVDFYTLTCSAVSAKDIKLYKGVDASGIGITEDCVPVEWTWKDGVFSANLAANVHQSWSISATDKQGNKSEVSSGTWIADTLAPETPTVFFSGIRWSEALKAMYSDYVTDMPAGLEQPAGLVIWSDIEDVLASAGEFTSGLDYYVFNFNREDVYEKINVSFTVYKHSESEDPSVTVNGEYWHKSESGGYVSETIDAGCSVGYNAKGMYSLNFYDEELFGGILSSSKDYSWSLSAYDKAGNYTVVSDSWQADTTGPKFVDQPVLHGNLLKWTISKPTNTSLETSFSAIADRTPAGDLNGVYAFQIQYQWVAVGGTIDDEEWKDYKEEKVTDLKKYEYSVDVSDVPSGSGTCYYRVIAYDNVEKYNGLRNETISDTVKLLPSAEIRSGSFNFSSAVTGGTGSTSTSRDLVLDCVFSSTSRSYQICYSTNGVDWTEGAITQIKADTLTSISLDCSKDYIVKIRTYDFSGAVGKYSSAIEVKGDSLAPVFNPGDIKAYVSCSASSVTDVAHILELKATDYAYDKVLGVGVGSYELTYWKDGYEDQTKQTVTISAQELAANDGIYSINLNGQYIWHWKLAATDKIGNATTAAVQGGTGTWNKSVPIETSEYFNVTVSQIKTEGKSKYADISVTWSAAETAADIESYRILLQKADDPSVMYIVTDIANEGQDFFNYSFKTNDVGYDSINLAEGNYIISVSAFDDNNNAYSMGQRSFNLDMTAPVPSDTAEQPIFTAPKIEAVSYAAVMDGPFVKSYNLEQLCISVTTFEDYEDAVSENVYYIVEFCDNANFTGSKLYRFECDGEEMTWEPVITGGSSSTEEVTGPLLLSEKWGYSSGALLDITNNQPTKNTIYWRQAVRDEAGNQTDWQVITPFVLTTDSDLKDTDNPTKISNPRNYMPTWKYDETTGDTSISSTFFWEHAFDVTGVKYYEIAIYNKSTKTLSCTISGLDASNLNGSSETAELYYTMNNMEKTLKEDGVYYWQIRAVDYVGHQGGWSKKVEFTIDTTAPTFQGGKATAPECNASLCGSNVLFTWDKAEDALNAVSYVLSVKHTCFNTATGEIIDISGLTNLDVSVSCNTNAYLYQNLAGPYCIQANEMVGYEYLSDDIYYGYVYSVYALDSMANESEHSEWKLMPEAGDDPGNSFEDSLIYDWDEYSSQAPFVDTVGPKEMDPSDFFKLTFDYASDLQICVSNTGTILGNKAAVKFNVYDSNLKKVKSASVSSGKTVTLSMQQDTVNTTGDRSYYVEIIGSNAKSTVSYEFSAAKEEYVKGNNKDDNYLKLSDDYVVDVENTAINIFEGEWVGFGDTIDYRKVNLDVSGSYSFYIDSTDKATVTLYTMNSKGKLQKVVSATVKKDSASTSAKLLQSGTYYMEVKSTKKVDADYEVGINDSSIFSEKTEMDQLTKGYVGGIDNLVDYYQFELTQADVNRKLCLNLESETSGIRIGKELKVTLYDNQGKKIALTSDCQTTKKALTSVGNYTIAIEVKRNCSADYNFTLASM